MVHADYALCFKALGDETRLKIVELLKCGSMCACKLLEQFSITQPTLSYHMKALVDCGLVYSTKQGIWNHYSVNMELLNDLSSLLSGKAECGNANTACQSGKTDCKKKI